MEKEGKIVACQTFEMGVKRFSQPTAYRLKKEYRPNSKERGMLDPESTTWETAW